MPDVVPAPELRHWHPVVAARDLGAKPRAVMLHGRELVLFRTAAGRDSAHAGIGALDNTCPHRRARLSDGWVEGDAIVCPYHGFRYRADGAGHSAGTPRMHLDARCFEVREAWDALWVRLRAPASDVDGDDAAPEATAFPTLGRDGFHHVGTLVHDVDCPLEPLVDNFSEVEHTPTTHALFGYRRDALDALEVTVELSPDAVRVLNEGPQKPLPALVERAFGIKSGDTFVDDWTVRFSPVHVVYDQWWRDPRTAAPRPDRLHLGVFFSPIDRDETRMVTVIFSNRRRSLLDPLLNRFLLALVDREVRMDRARVEGLADKSAALRGTRLGRFDAPLRELRKRIDTLYRGLPPR